MPPPARPSSGAASDALQAAVRALGTLSGQDSQDDQALEQSLHLPFLLPPARPPPAPAATAPPRRRPRQPAFSVASSSTASVPTAPSVIKRRRVIDEDEFPHVYSPLSDGGFTLGDCWNLHGREHCPVRAYALAGKHHRRRVLIIRLLYSQNRKRRLTCPLPTHWTRTRLLQILTLSQYPHQLPTCPQQPQPLLYHHLTTTNLT